jgi:hypothetical protein
MGTNKILGKPSACQFGAKFAIFAGFAVLGKMKQAAV